MGTSRVGLVTAMLWLWLAPGVALAQATAPSSITPDTLRPPPTAKPDPGIAPPAERLSPPKGAAALTVRLAAVDVEGGFPEVADQTRAIADRLVGRTVTLAEIYAAASAIEAAHARAGFVLARVSVPPQTLSDGGRVRVVVTDGFIERVDASAVPANIRRPVEHRVAGIVGERHLTLRDIEQPLLIAGAAPGLALTSTLARGAEAGGTQLLLGGRERRVTGSLTVDNDYARSLGRWGVTAQLALNSPFGFGEQLYGIAVSGYDVPRTFRADAPLRVYGGGVVLPSGDGRFSLNPEITFSRTQPFPVPGVPLTRGDLTRLTLRGSYVLARSRLAALSLDASLEHLVETNDAFEFATLLSRDRYTVGRVQLSYSGPALGGGIAVRGQLSRGLEGTDPMPPPETPPSRQGARSNFTRLDLTGRLARAVGRRVELDLVGRAQTSFGQPLFRSEQSALEGPDALSSYVGGTTAVDESITGRAELTRPTALPGAAAFLRLAPYLFAAAGEGWIDRPTAVEAPRFGLADLGVGVRAGLGRTGIALAVEYGHGFSANPVFDRVNRLAFSTSVVF